MKKEAAISKGTMEKIQEINTEIEKEELGAIDIEETTPEKGSFRDLRASDDGLNPDGTIVEDEEETQIEETPTGEVSTDETEQVSTNEEPAKIALPSRLIQAAYRSGLNDEDIGIMGAGAEKALSKLADNFDKISAQLGELGRHTAEAEAPEEEKFVIDKTELLEGREQFDAVEKRMNALLDRLATVEKSVQNKQSLDLDSKVDGFLDGKTEGYPELGDSKTLTEAQLAIRRNIFNSASDIQAGANVNGRPVALSEALERAFSIYESKNIKKNVEAEVLDGIKKRSKQLTTPPSQRKTQRNFKSQDEKAAASYAAKLQELGVAVPIDDDY